MKLRYIASGALIGIVLGILIPILFPDFLLFGGNFIQSYNTQTGNPTTYATRGSTLAQSLSIMPLLGGFVGGFIGFILFLIKRK